jgi:hypothetical protein
MDKRDLQSQSCLAELPRQSGLEKASWKAGENHEGTGEEINTPGCNGRETRGNTQYTVSGADSRWDGLVTACVETSLLTLAEYPVVQPPAFSFLSSC